MILSSGNFLTDLEVFDEMKALEALENKIVMNNDTIK